MKRQDKDKLPSKQQLVRITNILFPKSAQNFDKENQTNNMKSQIDKLRREVNIVVEKHENQNSNQLGQTTRKYLEKIKSLSGQLNDFPSQIYQASKTLVEAIPKQRRSEMIIYFYRMSGTFKIMEGVLQKIFKKLKMDAWEEMIKNKLLFCEQKNKSSKRYLWQFLILKAKFSKWRYTVQYQKSQQKINKITQEWNTCKQINIISCLSNESKLLCFLQSQIKDSDLAEILIYDTKTNSLTFYNDYNDMQSSSIESVSNYSHQCKSQRQIKKYQFHLTQSLTEICLKKAEVLFIENISQHPQYQNIDNPCQINLNTGTKTIMFKGAAFYPLLNQNGYPLGIIRQYYYQKPTFDNKRQIIAHYQQILNAGLSLRTLVRQYWIQAQNSSNNYYIKLIKIIRQLESLKQSDAIFQNLEQKLQKILPGCSLEVYLIKQQITIKQNIGQRYTFKIIYSKNQHSNSNHLVPSLNEMKINNINYVNCTNNLVFRTSKQVLFNVTNSQIKQNSYIPMDLLETLLKKVQEIRKNKRQNQQLMEIYQRQQKEANKIKLQNQLVDKLHKNLIELYSNTNRNPIKSVIQFLHTLSDQQQFKIMIKSHTDIVIELKKDNICFVQNEPEKIKQLRKDLLRQNDLLYHNQSFTIEIGYCGDKIQNSIVAILRNYISDKICTIKQSLNVSNNIQNLKLCSLSYQKGHHPYVKITNIMEQTFGVKCIVAHLQKQDNSSLEWFSFPDSIQSSLLMQISEIKQSEYFSKSYFQSNSYSLKNFKTLLKQNKIQNQFTIIKINNKVFIIINKFILYSKQLVNQVNNIYNKILKEEEEQLYKERQLILNKCLIRQISKQKSQVIFIKQKVFWKLKRFTKKNKQALKLILSIQKLIMKKQNYFFKTILIAQIYNQNYLQRYKEAVAVLHKFFIRKSLFRQFFSLVKQQKNQIMSLGKLESYIFRKENFLKSQFLNQLYAKYGFLKKYPILSHLTIGQNLKRQFFIKLKKMNEKYQAQSNLSNVCCSKTFKQLFKQLKINYPMYSLSISLPKDCYMVSFEKIISYEELKIKFQKTSKYQVITKGQKLTWYVEGQKEISLANKNQLAILSKGIIQFKKRFKIVSQPYLKLLIQNYTKYLKQIKKQAFEQLRRIYISHIKCQNYQFREKIYHTNLENQAIKEKIKIKIKQNEQFSQIFQKLEVRCSQYQQSIYGIKDKLANLEISSQQLQRTISLNTFRNNRVFIRYGFKKWRFATATLKLNNIQKNNKKLIQVGVKSLLKSITKISIRLVDQCYKILTLNYLKMRLQSLRKLENEQKDEISIKNKQGNRERLMTFQDNQFNNYFDEQIKSEDQGINKNVLSENNTQTVSIKKMNMGNGPQIQNFNVTDEQMNAINNVGYKLNVKTIKFLKRMGKINNL